MQENLYNRLYNESQVREIETRGIVVIESSEFPVYNQEFIFPHMVIAINKNGCSHAFYDQKEFFSNKNDVAVILPNHLIQAIESSDDYNVLLIVVSKDIVEEIKNQQIKFGYSRFHNEPSTKLSDEEINKLCDVVQIMKLLSEITDDLMPERHDRLVYILQIFFSILRTFNKAPLSRPVKGMRGNILFNQFCDLLAVHIRKHHNIGFYADKLYMTPKYLSQLIRETTGLTAGHWINEYLLAEAKYLLINRLDLNIQSICFMLGFKEQAAFNRFFTKNTGTSPKKFRQEQ